MTVVYSIPNQTFQHLPYILDNMFNQGTKMKLIPNTDNVEQGGKCEKDRNPFLFLVLIETQ